MGVMSPASRSPLLAGAVLCLTGTLFSAIVLADPANQSNARTPRIEVSDLKPLLSQAITQGSARGRLVGPGADYIRHRFGSSEPIEIDVLRLRPEATAGCARLRVITRQRGVASRESSKRSAPEGELVYQISSCANGHLMDTQEKP
jgi:hypothetical protein